MKRNTRLWLCIPVLIVSMLTIFYMLIPQYATNRDIGVIVSDASNPFFQRVLDSIKNTAKANAYNVKIIESYNDPDNELKSMETLVNKKYQIVLINPIDATLTKRAVAYAQNHNVKVITMDSKVNDLKVYAHIASNNLSGGKKAADYIIKALHNKGDIAIIRGVITTSSSQERYQGFVDRIKQSNIKIISVDNGNFTKLGGYHATKRIMKEYPNVKAIFYENDTMASGGLMAVNDNHNVVIVGFDGINEVLKLINQNRIDATVEQNPYAIGEFSTRYAIDYLSNDKKIKNNSVLVPVALVTKKEIDSPNYKSCYRQTFFNI